MKRRGGSPGNPGMWGAEGMRVRTGLERLLESAARYRGRKIGLIVNQTSVGPGIGYSWRLLERAGIGVRRIFSPEHGLFGEEQDQIASSGGVYDGIEAVSLYGSTESSLVPGRRHIDDLDLVIFDIQDIGARYYTFVNTMALFMKALSGTGISFAVLDRPNPLGGETVEGPLIDEGYESFVGVFNAPVRHGMTAGELARMCRNEWDLDIELEVLPMQGWRRDMRYADTGLPWVPPSPNMPTERTAAVYPGMCLFEGTGVSEGRGATTPFELIGAPFADENELAERLNAAEVPGAVFRPARFRPTFHKFRGQSLGGAYCHVTDVRAFRPFYAGVAAVHAFYSLYGELVRFPAGVYEFNDRHPAFDLLAGGPKIREAIVRGVSPRDIESGWKDVEREFYERRRDCLLY